MKADFVLIETSWNVKVDISDMPADFPYGINRNIVECKDIQKECKTCGWQGY